MKDNSDPVTCDRYSMNVGKLILCFACFEVEVDDTLWLANDRLDISALGLPDFPTRNIEKIQALAAIAKSMGIEWHSFEFEKKYSEIQELRNHLAHGRTTEFCFHKFRVCASISRRPIPQKISGVRHRVSQKWHVDLEFIEQVLRSLVELEAEIEELRKSLWSYKERWPNAQLTWEPKPFSAAIMSDRNKLQGEPDFYQRVFKS